MVWDWKPEWNRDKELRQYHIDLQTSSDAILLGRKTAVTGKDIIVYGGASFVGSLFKKQLIDEYHLLINPTILGKGKAIFKTIADKQSLALVDATSFNCGVVTVQYNKK
jgi:dihydrofolate reductase